MIRPGTTYDVLIIGGGVIGLSTAWELAQHGSRVAVVDSGSLGKEASWAGAGIIPSGPDSSHWSSATTVEQLAGLSQQLHPEWSTRLEQLTGIDNEYLQAGALQLAFTESEAVDLESEVRRWHELGIPCEPIDAAALADLEPALTERSSACTRAYCLPNDAQLRNPRHLRALVAACRQTHVELLSGVAVHQFRTSGGRISMADTSVGPIAAEQFCLTAGSWSGLLAASLNIELPVRPIRGQIVLLDGPSGLLRRNVNVGLRYMVPRRDGRLLIGATQEDVGYVKQNTAGGVQSLLEFAQSVAPQLAELSIDAKWSGLRPGTADGLPYLGRIPQFENGWLATGHFRAGLQLSPATAVVMRESMLGQQPTVDLTTLGLERINAL